MRPLLFFTADQNMAFALQGFFGRDHWHLAIPCAFFEFDPRPNDGDIKVAMGQNDSGLYTRAGELLRPFRPMFERVVILVDEEWSGSPGASMIQDRLKEHIELAGWSEENGLGLVLQPELDVWLWSGSPGTARAMRWDSVDELYAALRKVGYMQEDQTKPTRPKEAAEWALRQKRRPRSSIVYREVASAVSIGRCQDPALKQLRQKLCDWFPSNEHHGERS